MFHSVLNKPISSQVTTITKFSILPFWPVSADKQYTHMCTSVTLGKFADSETDTWILAGAQKFPTHLADA